MSPTKYMNYEREIRLPNGQIAVEKLIASSAVHYQAVDVKLTLPDGSVGEFYFDHGLTASGSIDGDFDNRGLMPKWWQPVSPERSAQIAKKWQENNCQPVSVTRNVVTFAVSRRNGSMMGQFRSFVSPQGKPIGNPGMPSMHGGLMETDDMVDEAIREIEEEFGIMLEDTDLDHVGDVYDPDNGRFNHVFKVLPSYEDALISTHGSNVEAIMAAILDCEGLGRFSRMFKLDVERAIEIGAITPISIAILRAFPQLMPPTDPYAV